MSTKATIFDTDTHAFTQAQVALETMDFIKLCKMLGLTNGLKSTIYHKGFLASDAPFSAIIRAKQRAALALCDNGYATLTQRRLGPSSYEYHITLISYPSVAHLQKTAHDLMLRKAAKDPAIPLNDPSLETKEPPHGEEAAAV